MTGIVEELETAPARIIPRLIRNMAPTVMTAGLAKPETASFVVNIFVSINTTMIPTR